MRTILLDMDGVIVNFVEGANKVHYKTPIIWNRWEAYKDAGLTTSDFWEKITNKGERFWYELEPYPWANELINILTRQFGLNIIFCSTPAKDGYSAAGKMHWLEKYYPTYAGDFILTPRKDILSNSGCIMLDDSDDNINAYSGDRILFPQPWNKNKGKHKIAHVSSKLTTILSA